MSETCPFCGFHKHELTEYSQQVFDMNAGSRLYCLCGFTAYTDDMLDHLSDPDHYKEDHE